MSARPPPTWLGHCTAPRMAPPHAHRRPPPRRCARTLSFPGRGVWAQAPRRGAGPRLFRPGQPTNFKPSLPTTVRAEPVEAPPHGGCDASIGGTSGIANGAVPPFDRLRTNGLESPEHQTRRFWPNGFESLERQTRPFGHTVEAEGAGVRAEVLFAAPRSAESTSVEGEHITRATSRSARACTGSAHAGALCRFAAQHLRPINQRKRKPIPERSTGQHSTAQHLRTPTCTRSSRASTQKDARRMHSPTPYRPMPSSLATGPYLESLPHIRRYNSPRSLA